MHSKFALYGPRTAGGDDGLYRVLNSGGSPLCKEACLLCIQVGCASNWKQEGYEIISKEDAARQTKQEQVSGMRCENLNFMSTCRRLATNMDIYVLF